jgi:hypothetical protein
MVQAQRKTTNKLRRATFIDNIPKSKSKVGTLLPWPLSKEIMKWRGTCENCAIGLAHPEADEERDIHFGTVSLATSGCGCWLDPNIFRNGRDRGLSP